MAIIYSYPLNDDIKLLDELVGTTEKNINGQLKTVTRNFLLQDLAEFFIVDGGLQRTITVTTSGTSGPSTLDQLTGILNIPEYLAGTVTSITALSPLTGGTILDQGSIGIQIASETQDGALSALNWNTFNNKQTTITLTVDGTAGAATFNPATGALNIPQYASPQNLQSVTDLGSTTTNSITANSFVKSGGTSSQILAADGSVITAGTNIIITGGTISATGGGSVTSVTAISPITSSGGTTPVISTSMATNKLIGRSTTGSGVMEEITVGSGLTLSAGTLNNTATPTPTGYYGAFQDMLTQTLTTVNVGQPFLIRTVDESNQVSITTNGSGQLTRITPTNTGIYNIQWSGQFQNPTNAIHDINVWFRKGLTSSSGPGTDIVGSNGLVALPARKSASAGEEGHIVAGWNFLLTIAAGEYVEFYWMSSSTQVTLQAYSAGSPPPSTASLIVTVTQQSGIMAGTGITGLGTSGNAQTGAVQTLTTNGNGTDFNIVSSGNTHTFNLPTASATNRGALSSANWTTFNNKQSSSTNLTSLSGLTYSTPAFVKMTSAGTFTLDTSGGGTTTLSVIGSTPNANAATITGSVLNLEPASVSFGGVITTGAQTIAGVKTFNSSPIAPTLATGTVSTAIATTEFVTNAINTATPGTGYTVYNILITTSGNITTQTTGIPVGGSTSYVQNGRNVMINNSATAIEINPAAAVDGFIASYTKIGTADITFSALTSPLVYVNALNGRVLSGLPGSTALLVKNGNNYYLSINNIVAA